MSHLTKTETESAVTYTGEDGGFVLVIDKDATKVSLHQSFLPSLVDGKTWQQLVSEVDANNET